MPSVHTSTAAASLLLLQTSTPPLASTRATPGRSSQPFTQQSCEPPASPALSSLPPINYTISTPYCPRLCSFYSLLFYSHIASPSPSQITAPVQLPAYNRLWWHGLHYASCSAANSLLANIPNAWCGVDAGGDEPNRVRAGDGGMVGRVGWYGQLCGKTTGGREGTARVEQAMVGLETK